jgi:hypothetical protein
VARGSGSPELGVPAAPGAKSTRAWVGRDPRDKRELPKAKARHGRGSSDEHDGGGGSARRRNDGARVPRARKDPGLGHLAHKLRGFDAMLTRGLRRSELRRKEDDDDDRRRRGWALMEEGDAEVAGVLGLRKSAPGTSVEVTMGLREPTVHRRQGIAAAAVLTGGSLREEIRTEERAEIAGEGRWSFWVVGRC